VANLTVRNVDAATLQWLRERAAARSVSMEQEARDVLYASLGFPTSEGFDHRGIVVDPVDGDREAAPNGPLIERYERANTERQKP
jgi:plasmid stability protein